MNIVPVAHGRVLQVSLTPHPSAAGFRVPSTILALSKSRDQNNTESNLLQQN